MASGPTPKPVGPHVDVTTSEKTLFPNKPHSQEELGFQGIFFFFFWVGGVEGSKDGMGNAQFHPDIKTLIQTKAPF